MTWLNPLALVGLLSVTLPIVIHLLGRGDARRRVFPSLRFLPSSRSIPTRRTRLRDVPLLVIRVAILAAAALALAGPSRAHRTAQDASAGAVARAIIIDTSVSTSRSTPSGERGTTVMRREARRLADESHTSIVIESAEPAAQLAGAIEWLSHQPLRREIAIVSDFQVGAVDTAVLRTLPDSVGLRLRRVAVTGIPPVARFAANGSTISTRAERDQDGQRFTWQISPAKALDDRITILAGPNDRVDALQRAVRAIPVAESFDSTHHVLVVFPAAQRRDELIRLDRRKLAPWMADLLVSLHADSTLLAAAGAATPLPSRDSAALSVVRSATGARLIDATALAADGMERLVLFVRAEPTSFVSAALVAALRRSRPSPIPPSELEPESLTDAQLRHYERVPGSIRISPTDSESSSLSRWFWALVLVLLVIEWWMRRTPPEVSSEFPHSHARAA